MAIDLVGDGGKTRPPSIGGFEHWWNEVQKYVPPYRHSPGETLARIAWNAALEKAARECGAMQLSGASVNYAAVCRQLQVAEDETL